MKREDTNERDIAELRDAIEAAQGLWVDADWTHELRGEGAVVRSDDGVPVYCNGEVAGCEYCADTKADAAAAEDHATAALAAARSGDFGRAACLLSKARHLEAAYGDAPTWSPVAELADELERKWDDCCEPCGAYGILTPAEVEAIYLDGEGETDGKVQRICRTCLSAGAEGGPGYVERGDS